MPAASLIAKGPLIVHRSNLVLNPIYREIYMKIKNLAIFGNRQKDQSGGIQIQPPQGPLSLYKSYTLTVTVDNPNVYSLFWSAGPEDPSPGEGKPGHTFLFDNYAQTNVKNGTGTINIIAVGPNSSTTVTVYARSLDDTPIGSAVLEFGAVEMPPNNTLGLVSLDGTPLLTDTAIHLVRATFVDADGTPLTGTVTWQATFGTIPADRLLLDAQTQLNQDGTTTNGVHYPPNVGGAWN